MDTKKLIASATQVPLTIPAKLSIYKELSRCLRQGEIEDSTFKQLWTHFYDFALRDIEATDASICAMALEALGFFVQKMKSFNEQEMRHLVHRIVDCIIQKNEKEISRNGMWCIQKLVNQSTSKLPVEVCKTLVVDVIPKFLSGTLIPSSSVCISIPDLLLMIHGIKPSLLESHLPVFLTQIFGFLTNNVPLVRAAGLRFMKHFPTASAEILFTELKKVKRRTEFCDSLVDLLVKQQEDALDIWEFVVRSLGVKLSMSVDLLNALLRIPEKAFGSSNLSIREKAFSRWSALIEVFGTDHAVLNHEKRLRLLLVPLQNTGKSESIVAAQMKVWLKLLQELGRGTHDRYRLVVEPFFELLFKENRGVVYLHPNLLSKVLETWSEILKLLPPVEFRLRYKSFFAQAEQLVELSKDKSEVLAVLYTMTESATRCSSPKKTSALYEPYLEKLWNSSLTFLENAETAVKIPKSSFFELLRLGFAHRAGKLDSLARVVQLALQGNPLNALPELRTVLAEEILRPETVHCWTTATSLAVQYKGNNPLVEFDITKVRGFVFLPFRFDFTVNKLALTDLFLDTFEKLCLLYCNASVKKLEGGLDVWLENVKEPTNSLTQGHVFLHVALLSALTTSAPALTEKGWQGPALKWLRFVAKELVSKENLPEAGKWQRKFGSVVGLLIEAKDVQKQELDKLREATLPVLNHVTFSHQNKTLDQLFKGRFEQLKQEMKTRSKEATAVNKRKAKLGERDAEEDFVVIAPTPPKTPQVLTEHQKEVKRTRRSVIPAMYNDYSQSLGCEDSQLVGLPVMPTDEALEEKVAAIPSLVKNQDATPSSRTRILRSRKQASSANANPSESTTTTNTPILAPAASAQLPSDIPTTDVATNPEPDEKSMAKPRTGKKGRKKKNAATESIGEPVKTPEPTPSEAPNDSTPLDTSTTSTTPEIKTPASDAQLEVSRVVLHMSSTSLDTSSLALDDTVTEGRTSSPDSNLPEKLPDSSKSSTETSNSNKPPETLTPVAENTAQTHSPSLSPNTTNENLSGAARTDPREQIYAHKQDRKATTPENPSSSPVISVVGSPTPDSVPPVVVTNWTNEKRTPEPENDAIEPPTKKRALITVKKMPLEDWCRQATSVGTNLSTVTEKEPPLVAVDQQMKSSAREVVVQPEGLNDVTSAVESDGERDSVNRTETEESSAAIETREATNNALEPGSAAEGPKEDRLESAGMVQIKAEPVDGEMRISKENHGKTSSYKIGRSELQSKLLEAIVRQNEGKGFTKVVSSKPTRKSSPNVSGFRGAKFLELAQAKKSLNTVKPVLVETPNKKKRPDGATMPNSPASQEFQTVKLATPTGSPSGGILKRRLANGETPSPKSRKVSFADAEVREESVPSPYRKSRRSLTLGESTTDEQLATPLEAPAEKEAKKDSCEELAENCEEVAENREATDSVEVRSEETVEAEVETVITEANEKSNVESNQDGPVTENQSQTEKEGDVELQPVGEEQPVGDNQPEIQVQSEIEVESTDQVQSEIEVESTGQVQSEIEDESMDQVQSVIEDEPIVEEQALVANQSVIEAETVVDDVPVVDGEVVIEGLSTEISSEPEVPTPERLIEGTKNGLISRDTILAMIESLPVSNEERVDFLCLAMKRVLTQPR